MQSFDRLNLPSADRAPWQRGYDTPPTGASHQASEGTFSEGLPDSAAPPDFEEFMRRLGRS